jgi:hypothetical protein
VLRSLTTHAETKIKPRERSKGQQTEVKKSKVEVVLLRCYAATLLRCYAATQRHIHRLAYVNALNSNKLKVLSIAAAQPQAINPKLS